jgi:SAM-dependent methyltransferase
VQNKWKASLKRYYETEYRGVISDPSILVEELLDVSKDKERVRILIETLKLDGQSRILEGGSGAGGTLLQLLREGYDAYGVEPDPILFQIAHERLQEFGFEDRILNSNVGNSSLLENHFNNFFSFQVLEHVEDIDGFFRDMIRVLKNDSRIYLAVPNYNFIWEPHYALIFPLFLGKKLFQFYLFVTRRNTKYLECLNFVTPRKLRRKSKTYGIILEGLGKDIFLQRVQSGIAPTYGRTASLFKLFQLARGTRVTLLVCKILIKFDFYYPIYMTGKISKFD